MTDMKTTEAPKTEGATFKPKKSVALSGVAAGNTALCSVGRSGNDLHYRGYDILDVAGNSEFEEIAYLLVHGKLPNEAELRGYKAKLKSLRGLPHAVKAALEALLERLEDNELDEYGDVATLIGVEFDENTVWGQLTVQELKLQIHLALQNFEEAQELVEAFLQYNDNTIERRLFYQAVNVVLEVELDEELDLDDYEVNFRRMYGNERMDAVLARDNQLI